MMDAADRERYSRQILFGGIGERGQEALRGAHAAIAGCGALGSFHAAALARAGVGTITIVDRDYVEPSNLQRQWLFEEADAAQALPKAAGSQANHTVCGLSQSRSATLRQGTCSVTNPVIRIICAY